MQDNTTFNKTSLLIFLFYGLLIFINIPKSIFKLLATIFLLISINELFKLFMQIYIDTIKNYI